MATTQNLTIRIGADASGAMSVLSATTEQVNRLNTAGNSAAQGGVASLSGGVQNLGRWSSTSVQAMASMSGGIQNIGRDAGETAREFSHLGNQFAVTNSGIILTARSAREASPSLGQLASQANQVTTTMHTMTAAMGSSAQSSARWVEQLNSGTRATIQLNNELSQTPTRATTASGSLNAVSGALNSIKGVLGGVAAALGVRELIQYMDDWSLIEGRMKLVTNTMQELRDVQSGLSTVAKETRSDLTATSDLYYKMALYTKDSGKSQQELLSLVTATNKAIIISGSGAMEAKNALLQFGQALASNRLGGDELRSMMEQTPRLVLAIREGLGVTNAEFKKMAENSELTSKVVMDSLEKMKGKLSAEFGMMPVTIGQSFTMLNNAMTEFVGKGGQTSGAADGIANSIKFVAEHVTELSKALTVVVGAFAAYKVAVIAAEIQTAILNRTMSVNPWIAAVTVIGTVVGALYAFKDDTVKVGESTVTVGSVVKTVWWEIKDGIDGTIKSITDFFNKFESLKTIKDNSIGYVTDSYDYFFGKSDYEKRNGTKKQAANQTGFVSQDFINGLGAQAKAIDDGKYAIQKARDKQYDDLKKTLGLDAPEIKVKASVVFDEDKYKKDIDKTMGRLTPELNSLFENAAQKYSVPANLLKAIGIVESKLQNGLTSSAGAIGLMQIKPKEIGGANLGFTAEQLKDENTSIEAGAKLLDYLYKKYHSWDMAIQLFHDGESTKILENINKNNGVLNVGLLVQESRDYTPKVEIGLKALNTTLSETIKGSKEAEQASKKIATEQENAAKKIADAQQKIYESTAFGTAEKAMNVLDKQYSTGVMSMTEYQNEQDKIMAAYEKSISPIIVLTDAQKELNRVLADAPVNKLQDEFKKLNAQSAAGLLKPNEYEHLSKKAFESYGQAAFGDKPAAEKDTKAYDNELEGLNKIRREIEFSDEAMYHYDLTQRKAADGSKLFSDEEIANLERVREEVQNVKFLDDLGLSTRKLSGEFSTMFSQVLVEGKSFTDSFRGMMHGMINSVSTGLMNAGFTSGNPLEIAGGVAVGLLGSLFKDKTIDYTHSSADTTGTVLGTSDPSNSLHGVISTLYDIHAQQFPVLKKISDEFTLMSKGVDNTIAMAIKQHGTFVPSTNGMKTAYNGANEKQFLMGLGTTAVSAGLAAAGVGTSLATTALASMISTSVAVTGGASAVTGALVSTSAALMAGGLAAAAAMGGIGLLVGGAIYGLGKLLGIGKTKFTAIGSGIIANINTAIVDGVVSAQSTVYDYSTVKAVTKGWFSNTTKIYDVINGIDSGLSVTFDNVFNNLYSGLSSVADVIHKKSEFVAKASEMTPITMGFNFTGKTGDEISSMLSQSISTMSDKIATYFFGGIFGGLQRMGEGMLQTTIRVIAQAQEVIYQFGRLSSSPVVTIATGMKNLDVTSIALSDSLIAQYESSTNANDGLKNFTASMNAFYDATTSAGKKVGDAIDTVNNAISTFKASHPSDTFMTNATANSPNIGDILSHMATVQHSDAKSVSASSGYDNLVNIGDTVKNAFSPSQAFDESALSTVAVNAWKNIVGGDFNSATWSSGQLANPDYQNKLRSGADAASKGDLYFKGFDTLVATIDANTKAQQEAQAALKGTGIASKSDYDSKLAAAKTQVDAATATMKVTTDLSGYASILNQNMDTVNSLIQSSLKSTINVTKQNQIARGIEYSSGAFSKTDDLTSTLSQFDKSYSTHILPAIQSWMKTSVDFKNQTNISTAALKAYNYAQEDSVKLLDRLKAAGTALSDVSVSIGKWVQNLKATSVGSPETQLAAAKANFDAQNLIIKTSVSAEEKQAALSGITSVADTYIAALKNYYGTGLEGQSAIAAVVDSVSKLPATVDIQTLQLGVLQDMKNGVLALPASLSSIQNAITAARNNYNASPTLQNSMNFDAIAKIGLSLYDASQAGATSSQLTAMMNSIAKGGVLDASINAIITSATLDPTQKSTMVGGILDQFNAETINFKNFGFDVQSAVKTANDLNDALQASIKPVVLTVNPDAAKVTIKGLQDGALTQYNNTKVDAVLDVSGDKTVNATVDNTKSNIVDFAKYYQASTGVVGTSEVITDAKNTKVPLDALNGFVASALVTVDGSGAINTLNGIINTANQTASALSALGVAQSNYAAQQAAAAAASIQAAQAAQQAAQAQAAQAAQAMQLATAMATLPSTGLTLTDPSAPLSVSGISAANDFAINNSPTVVAQNPTLNGSAGLSISNMPMFATGGAVFGAGTSTSDSIHAMLSNGEYVLNADTTSRIGVGNLDRMNFDGETPKFATGGVVGEQSSVKPYIPNQEFSPIFTPQQQPASESNKELVEEVKKLRAELKIALDALNKKTDEGNNIKRAGFNNGVQENKQQTTSLHRLETKTRIQNTLTGARE